MGKFRHALPRLHFGGAAPAMLTQQDRDQPGLHKNNRAHEHDLPQILLPYSFFPKVDFAVRREAAFADAPTPHLSPIENCLVAEALGKILRRRRARQEPQNHAGRIRTMSGETIQASPDDPAAEVLVEKAIDGYACRAGNTFNNVVRNEWLTAAVLKHRYEEDNVSGRQL